jgi:hypothetical protein
MITWKGLFTKVEGGYRDILQMQIMKAPDDPRIKGIVDLG